ncbi:hypothetical protein WJX73_010031 [Symbiochloris irregularis]|uniref:AAA+ ATPase domain-containing protein n=1 Tax=Symbiochloris irregularis TaxID=706552 RepID=A0AAW1PS69_9CHLO
MDVDAPSNPTHSLKADSPGALDSGAPASGRKRKHWDSQSGQKEGAHQVAEEEPPELAASQHASIKAWQPQPGNKVPVEPGNGPSSAEPGIQSAISLPAAPARAEAPAQPLSQEQEITDEELLALMYSQPLDGVPQAATKTDAPAAEDPSNADASVPHLQGAISLPAALVQPDAPAQPPLQQRDITDQAAGDPSDSKAPHARGLPAAPARASAPAPALPPSQEQEITDEELLALMYSQPLDAVPQAPANADAPTAQDPSNVDATAPQLQATASSPAAPSEPKAPAQPLSQEQEITDEELLALMYSQPLDGVSQAPTNTDAPSTGQPSSVAATAPHMPGATGLPAAPEKPNAAAQPPSEEQEITDGELLALMYSQPLDGVPAAAPTADQAAGGPTDSKVPREVGSVPAPATASAPAPAKPTSQEQEITDEELLALMYSQPLDGVPQAAPAAGQPAGGPADSTAPGKVGTISLPPAPARTRTPAQPPSQEQEITDEELLALMYSQPLDGIPQAAKGQSVADERAAVSSSAKRKFGAISLPPAPHSTKASLQPHAQQSQEITDEELLAMAFGDDSPPATDHRQGAPQSSTAVHREPQHAPNPAAAGRLYMQHDSDPMTDPTEPEDPMMLDSEEEDDSLLRDWNLPALNPMDIDGSAMTVMCEGMRVYCRMRSKIEDEPDTQGMLHNARRGGLLAQPVPALMRELEERDLQAALAESEAAPAAAEARAEAGDSRQAKPSKRRKKGAKKQKTLWVDKYSPHSYLELLSEEGINREVAQWLMTWRRHMDAADRPPGSEQQRAVHRPKRAPAPEQKLLLMCGPPGLGKTTLAHVVARHCGFRPMEINASDERTAGSLTSRINDAVQMQAVMDDRRPNCVIIDEIDGATGGSEGRSAIHALLKIIQAGPSKGQRPGSSGAAAGAEADGDAAEPSSQGGPERQGARQRGRGASKALNRPLIAICNDLYAPALRPLRTVAKIVQFKTTQAHRLTERLQQICTAESLSVEKQALVALCDGTQQDVRACLNTLQFLARRCSHVQLQDVEGAAVGQKDLTRSAFSLWQRLLTAPGPRQPMPSPTGILYDHLLDFGDLDLMCQGVLEHAYHLRYMDVHMHMSALMADRLADADMLSCTAMRRSSFTLLKYGPAMVLNVRRLVSTPGRVQLRWPKTQGDAHRGRTANLAMLRAWLQEAAPLVACHLPLLVAVQEVLPALVAVVAQKQRMVAKHLLTPEEVAGRSRLVTTMLDYGFSFAMGGALEALNAANGESDIVLAPPVHRVTCFEGQPSGSRKLPLPVRQLLAHEAHMQLIQRREQARQAAEGEQRHLGGVGPAAMPPPLADSSVADGAGAEEPAAAPAAPQLMLSVAERVSVGAAKKPAKKMHWLGQLRQKHEQKLSMACQHNRQRGSGEAGGQEGAAAPVLYKFHEGYTNAVKRPVRMKDLL